MLTRKKEILDKKTEKYMFKKTNGNQMNKKNLNIYKK